MQAPAAVIMEVGFSQGQHSICHFQFKSRRDACLCWDLEWTPSVRADSDKKPSAVAVQITSATGRSGDNHDN
jgi:hypothetical protein